MVRPSVIVDKRLSKIALDLLGVLHEGLDAEHVAACFGEAWVGPDHGVALHGGVCEDGGVATDEGDVFERLAGECLSEAGVIPGPALRQG